MSLFGVLKEARAALLSNAATKAAMGGDFGRAEALYRKSLGLMEQGGRGPLQTAFHVAGLANALDAQGRPEECVPLATRAITMLEQLEDVDEAAEVMTSMMTLLLSLQAFGDAVPLLRRVTSALDRVHHRAIAAVALREIADELLFPVFRDPSFPDAPERLAEAEALYRRAGDMSGATRRRTTAGSSPDRSEEFWILDGLGRTLMLMGRLDEAEELQRVGFGQLESVFRADPHLYIRACISRGDVLSRMDNHAEAVEFFTEALTGLEGETGLKVAPELLGLVERTAASLRQLGRIEEAETYERRADAIRQVDGT